MVRIGTGRVRVLAMEIVYRFRLSEDAEFVWGVAVEGPPPGNTRGSMRLDAAREQSVQKLPARQRRARVLPGCP